MNEMDDIDDIRITDNIGINGLFRDSDESHYPLIRSVICTESSIERVQGRTRECFLLSILRCMKTTLELSAFCGILFGLFATLLWWIELNAKPYCTGKWDDIPEAIHRFAMIASAVKAVIIMFWPLLTIAPICSWPMIRDSNVISWCTFAGFADVIDRLFLFIFDRYKAHWRSYVGNVIFTLISFKVFYTFVKYRQKQSYNNENAFKLTLKLSLQCILGMVIFLPYNYMFLKLYQESTPLIRTILSCALIAVFYGPKLIIGNVITSLHGIYKPRESISFGAGFLIISTMVTRLTQARIESLSYFIIVSLVHGIVSVLDKLVLPVIEKLRNFFCKRSNVLAEENQFLTQEYIAHQSLISVITETTSVVMSNAAAYLLVYYYKKEESTGKRHDGSVLFREMVIRSSIAVSIEWVFSVVALKLQNDRFEIPVLSLWKHEWKFTLIIHFIQIIYVVAYFGHYINVVLLDDVISNSTHYCVGFFKKI